MVNRGSSEKILSFLSEGIASFINVSVNWLIFQSICPAQSTHLEHFQPTQDMPALQYLDVVDKGGMADRAGLRPGDFILQVRLVQVIE